MANYSNLKAAIAAAIKTNGNQEITGQVLQDVLTSVVSVIGANYTFAGVATPSTNPGTPDQNVFYIASVTGEYVNFGGISVSEDLVVLKYNGSWSKEVVTSSVQNSSILLSRIDGKQLYGLGGNNALKRFSIGTFDEGVLVSVKVKYDFETSNVTLENVVIFGVKAVINGVETDLYISTEKNNTSRNIYGFVAKEGAEYFVIGRANLNTPMVYEISTSKGEIITEQIYDSLLPFCVGFGKNIVLKGNGGNIVSKNLGNIKGKIAYIGIPKTWNVSNIPNIDFICFGITEIISGNENDLYNYRKISVPDLGGRVIAFEVKDNASYILKFRANINEYVEFFVLDDSMMSKIRQDGGLQVISNVFKECKEAWTDKDNIYESWPNGGVFTDGEDVVIVYNSREAHVTKKDSDIYIRKKHSLEDWYFKKLIKEHTSSLVYGNPSACKLNNGDYLVCAFVQSENFGYTEDVGKFLIMKSTDKGDEWTDLGYVKVNNMEVVAECMMDLFCSSTGRIFSFVGSAYAGYPCSYIMSEDSGETWDYIGDSFDVGFEEACFFEGTDGYIYSILRKNSSNPCLVKIAGDGSTVEVLYDTDEFSFPAYYNPSSIAKLNNGKLLLLAGSRNKGNGKYYPIIQAIVTESELLSNNINSSVILRYDAQTLMDFGYAHVVQTSDGFVYGYFYGGTEQGVTQIYEMIGLPV